MATWLKFLPIELKEVTDLVEPFQELKTDDNIVGEMSEDLKKLYTMWTAMTKMADQYKLNYKYSHSREDVIKASECIMKARALEWIFWVCINDEYELWDKPIAGVRSGWKVVWYERSEPDIHDFFKGMFRLD